MVKATGMLLVSCTVHLYEYDILSFLRIEKQEIWNMKLGGDNK